MTTASPRVPEGTVTAAGRLAAAPQAKGAVLLGSADVRDHVWALLSSFKASTRSSERRRNQRYPYPHLIRLTPVDANLQPLDSENLVVAGKNISEQGLCFFHLAPLTLRKAIVSLESGDGQFVSLLMDLTWCRFTHHGWYESGGYFIETVPTPQGLVR
jgi:hypothetical protein